jgi:drug/metabolite transporter (DMT)-like permease
MLLAGVAWGAYSLHARGVSDPLGATASNFARTVPVTLALSLVAAAAAHVTARGAALAILSGALASGVGYTLWYAALRGLTASRAAVLQLLVPVLAAGAAVVLLDERLTPRLLLATAAIVGGVARATARSAAPARP